MTQAPIPAPPPQARRPGPGLAMSLIVMGVGLVIAICAVVAIAIPFVGAFRSPTYDVPAQFSLKLRHAEYTVYQLTSTRSGLGSSSLNVRQILPESVQITAPDGSQVPVGFTSNDERLTRGSGIYTGSLAFTPPARGTYQINFTNDFESRVIIARSLTDSVESVLVWFAVGALGGLLMIVGLVLLIVGATRRGRAKRALYGYGAPVQQWGPPPQQQQWGPPQQQQWAPPQQQWGPPPQQQWGPPPQPPQQQQWPPPPTNPSPPPSPPGPPPSDPPAS